MPVVIDEKNFQWLTLTSTHIYVKEALAAIRAIQMILDSQTAPCIIYIGIDNSAAAAAVWHLHSMNEIVAIELAKLAYHLRESRSAPIPVSLHSRDNAADPVSRGETLSARSGDPLLASRCFQIMHLRVLEGKVANVYEPEQIPSWPTSGPRHPAVDDDWSEPDIPTLP